MNRFELKIGIVILFLSYASLCYAEDFRKSYFGMNLEKIKTLEPNFTYSAENQTFYGFVELAGRKAIASYHFVNGFFMEGRYGITEEYKNPQVWINEFLNFESLLITKYGTPDEKQVENWSDVLSKYKDMKELRAIAIQRSHLSITSRWKKPDKIVTLQIKGNDDNSISLGIYYSSLKYHDLITKRALKDL